MGLAFSQMKFAPHPSEIATRKATGSPEFSVNTGAYLFREGDPASKLYQVRRGVFRLTRMTAFGNRQVIAFGYPGDVLGFPCDGLYHSDCEAISNAQVLGFAASYLDNAERQPELHRMLMGAALREISAMQDHFMMLAKKSAVARVATFLSALADRIGEPMAEHTTFELSMPRADIADYIGLTTETVCRTLTQLRKCGVVEIDNIQTVIVLRPNALHALAEGDQDLCQGAN